MDVKAVVDRAKIGRAIGPMEEDQHGYGRANEIKGSRIFLENGNGGGDEKLVGGIVKLKKKKKNVV